MFSHPCCANENFFPLVALKSHDNFTPTNTTMTSSPSPSPSSPTVTNSPPLLLTPSMANDDTNFQKLLGMHQEVLTITKDQLGIINQMIQTQDRAHKEALESVNKSILNQETTLSLLSRSLKYITQNQVASKHQSSSRSQSSSTCQPSSTSQSSRSRSQPSLQSQCASYCRRYTLFTSKNTLLSESSNWIYPTERFYRPCLICRYYGHGFDYCPNLQKHFLKTCLRCYRPNHDAKSCRNEKRDPPFKEEYITPKELINSVVGLIR